MIITRLQCVLGVRQKKICTFIMLIFILHDQLVQIESFVPSCLRRNIKIQRTSTFDLSKSTLKRYASSEKKGKDEDSTSTWKLTEDWALIDKVAKFTVGTSPHTRTFWTQLLLSTPELSSKCEEDAIRRYEEIFVDPEKTGHPESLNLPESGPSPPLLQNWWMSTTNVGIVGGEVDGKTIWFPMQCIGRLDDDPGVTDNFLTGDPNMDNVNNGGFVEAIGGRIFELGRRRMDQAMTTATSTSQISSKINANNLGGTSNYENSENSAQKENTWNVIKSNPPIFAGLLAAVFVLSSWTGFVFGNGLSIAGDINNNRLSASTSTEPTSIVAKQQINQQKYGSGGLPSVSEQRARTEARVLQERRILSNVQTKLEKDEIKLDELRKQEATESLGGFINIDNK